MRGRLEICEGVRGWVGGTERHEGVLRLRGRSYGEEWGGKRRLTVREYGDGGMLGEEGI